jgi:hypothetical protein
MTSHATSNLPSHEQHITTKMSNCIFVFEAFHLCGHRKITEKHAESCPRKGLKVLREEGPQCDDYRREFHYHQAKCDLCMVDANNPDMVTRDISGLYLTKKEIEEVRKGPTFQTHKEFCCAEAEPEARRVGLTPEQTLAESQSVWKRQRYQDKREYRAQEKKSGVDKEKRAKFYDPDAESSDFIREVEAASIESEECRVCYENLKTGKPRQLPCGLIFHLDCLRFRTNAHSVAKNGQ